MPFLPKTVVRDGRAYLHVTFPDGSAGDLSYPSELDLAGHGVQPDVTLVWDGDYIAPIVFTFGGPYEDILDSKEPASGFRTADGWDAGVWKARAPPHHSSIMDVDRWLVVSLPSWTVHIPVPHAVEPVSVADAVRPWESSGGFVALSVSSPAELPEWWGEDGGAGLQFGDNQPLEYLVGPSDGSYLILAPEDCSLEHVHSAGPLFGATCLADGEVYFSVELFDSAGDRERVETLIEVVEFENFRPAS
jgi:hypothetical protein